MKKLKTYLLTGLLIWLPIGLTIWIIKFIIQEVDQFMPSQLTSKTIFGVHILGSGLIITVIILLITGVLATNLLGLKLINIGDKIMSNIPIVKSIYKGIKQVSDTLLSGSGHAFRKALLVRFPHTQAWTIAFITGTPSPNVINHDSNDNYINVYIPTTPNPTSGYFVILHKNDTMELNMTVEEALRYVISMGTVDPTLKTQK